MYRLESLLEGLNGHEREDAPGYGKLCDEGRGGSKCNSNNMLSKRRQQIASYSKNLIKDATSGRLDGSHPKDISLILETNGRSLYIGNTFWASLNNEARARPCTMPAMQAVLTVLISRSKISEKC